jgi:hypothetical protein
MTGLRMVLGIRSDHDGLGFGGRMEGECSHEWGALRVHRFVSSPRYPIAIVTRFPIQARTMGPIISAFAFVRIPDAGCEPFREID